MKQNENMLAEKDSRINELISQLSTLESSTSKLNRLTDAQSSGFRSASAPVVSANPTITALEDELVKAQKRIQELSIEKDQGNTELLQLQKIVDEFSANTRQTEARLHQLETVVDGYKASLIDAESKLQVAYEQLDTYLHSKQ